MSPRQIIVLLIALAAAVGAVLLIRGMAPETIAPAAETAPAEGARVLVMTRDLPQGSVIAAGDIEWRPFPEESASEAFVLEAAQPDALEALVGAVTRRPFVMGEPIASVSVIQPGDQSLLAAQLPVGYRAVSIEVDESSVAGGYIQPNDRVDVILTTRIEIDNGERGGASEEVRTDVILEDVRVLAVGGETQSGEGEEGGPRRIDAATAVLELSQGDARTIAMAETLGVLRLALRGVEAEPPEFRAPTAQRYRARALEQGAMGGDAVRVHGFGAVGGE